MKPIRTGMCGAQYLHGEGNNQVFDICNQLGCLADDQNKSGQQGFLPFIAYLRSSISEHEIQLNCKVTKVMSEWYKNRFICGAYSYHSVRSSREDHELLQKPYIPGKLPRILFAGEAIHTRFFFTIHGAFESGIHEAQQILSIFEDNQ
ncbi:unnamed protein product [Rotaria sp. Silwood1]|nr:unnamed protein product [Rotaria sp. Silwood1]